MSGSLGDFDASAVIYGKFTTYRPSSGAPFTLAGTPALSVYKDGSTTQSTSGVTLTVDFDSVTGLHHFAIDTSADGAFYAAGSFFDIVITTGTVDSVSAVGTVVGKFSIRKTSALKPATAGRTLVVDASGLADANVVKVAGTTQTAGDIIASIDAVGTVGGAAVNIDAAGDNYAGGISGVTSGTTKVGTETGTFSNTSFENLTYHTMTHSGNAIDIVYQYLTGGGTTPVGARWIGYLTSANDTVTVSAWNHVGAAWEAIGSIVGTAGTSNSTYNLTLYPRHSGTSVAELGKVYIRLHCTAQTSPVLNTDQLVVSYAVTSRTAGYADGAVWLDTVDGIAGTEAFVNGTADNPASSFANAVTIATSVNLHKFAISNGSSITLAAAADNYVLQGHEWTLALGGQSIASTMIVDAEVSGVSTGSDAEFETCIINNATVYPCFAWECMFKGTFTIGVAGDYFFVDCASGVAGMSTPVFDMGAAVGATNISFRRWSGGMTINNLASGDVISLDVVSGGTITLNGADATVVVRGMCNVVNNLTGSPSVTTTSVLNQSTLATPTNITAGTIATVSGNVNGSVGSVASGVTVTTNNDKTGYALSSSGVTAIWDEVMTGTTTAVQAMRGFLAVLLGKASGLATTTAVYRNVADTKDVVTATVDVDGNRTAVTTDLT